MHYAKRNMQYAICKIKFERIGVISGYYTIIIGHIQLNEDPSIRIKKANRIELYED